MRRCTQSSLQPYVSAGTLSVAPARRRRAWACWPGETSCRAALPLPTVALTSPELQANTSRSRNCRAFALR